jgi:hypothetical protein
MTAQETSFITAGGAVGLGGNVDILATPGALGVGGGNVSLTANGGSGLLGLFGSINLTAQPGTDSGSGITTGGAINITANSGFSLSNLTSKISLTAGGINSYAGITSPIASLEGYNFIQGSLGVSLVAGSVPSGFQVPGTVYLYGATGVVLNSDVYTTAIYPYWNGLAPPANLSINGRTTISGNAYVNINNVNTINFEAGQAGALTGVQSINGSAYPPSITAGVASLNSITGAVNLVAGANVSISPGSPTSQDITINATVSPPVSFVDAYQIYVAPNGNDTTGTGSQQNPFLTIGQAITFRATLSATIEVSIILSSGSYTENITLTRNTFLVGVQTGEVRQPCNITGTITMSDTLGGSTGLTGLEINGAVSMTGVAGLIFSIFGCNISGGASNSITANSGSLLITESRINTTTGLCISASTSINIRDCVLIQNGTSPCIETSGGSTIIRQCFISSTSTSTSPSALIRFTNTGNATSEIGFCRIEYISNATDTVGNKCCIQYAGSGFHTSSVYNNLLLCQGAITANGGGQIQCIQDPGTGGVNLSYGQLIAGATAHHIASAITKTQYNSVP